jgi:enoyl-CoA hydratase/carnithine racemase
VNRVVPAEELEAEVAALASELAAKPSVPVIVTKEHVNAVTRSMGAGLTSFADGDVLLGTVFDRDALAAASRYVERSLGTGTKRD